VAGLKITPEIARAAYAYLDETPPFSGWNLPEADDVKFVIGRAKDAFGHADWSKRTIWLSQARIGCTRVLIETLAHEMIHFHADRSGETHQHGPLFLKAARQVCEAHGFDYKSFI